VRSRFTFHLLDNRIQTTFDAVLSIPRSKTSTTLATMIEAVRDGRIWRRSRDVALVVAFATDPDVMHSRALHVRERWTALLLQNYVRRAGT
jgi:hypothetical protein